MSLVEVSGLYLLAGGVSAVVLSIRGRELGYPRVLYIALALLLWPLWLPVVLARPKPGQAYSSAEVINSERALWQGYEAVKGTPLERLLPLDAVERITAALRRVGTRDHELGQILLQPGFNLEAARTRVAQLQTQDASPRALGLALRHCENIERLTRLRSRDRQVLEELSDWLSILRTQLVLARYSGSSVEGVGDIFAEVSARVEVLGSTFEEAVLLPPLVPESAWQNTFS